MAKILVTGGCGYIGSHTIVDLVEHGYEVVSVDNNSRSTDEGFVNIEKITGVSIKNHKINLCDLSALSALFEAESVDGIIHFAAFKTVPESVEQPLMYYENNLVSLLNLLKLVDQHNIQSFVFSSSCSVYGNADKLPVDEQSPLKKAESPYAYTKQVGEQMIEDYAKVNPQQFVLLRYFNPVGAHQSALIGENPFTEPENLLPRITGTALGQFPVFKIMGKDYDTRDGTCIRDYIHVMDIAHAHTKAIEFMANKADNGNLSLFNLGTGNGVSVLEAVKAFEKVSDEKLNWEYAPARAGDVVAVYADNSKANELLGWQPKYSLEDMMKTAWDWARR